MSKTVKNILILPMLLVVVILSSLSRLCLAVSAVDYRVPRQNLGDALRDFSQQSDVQIIFSTESVKNKTSSPLQGGYAVDEGLDILLKDTGLTFSIDSNRVVVISPDDDRPIKKKPPMLLAETAVSPSPGSAYARGYEEDEAQRALPVRAAIEEVIVTAEKRNASVRDTAMAISAFDSQTMRAMGISQGNDYMNHTPSLSYRSNPARLFIRGVGLQDNVTGVDSGIAVYVDGLYSTDVIDLTRTSFDTERVEILRGPQGTLYGRNATGGAINIISKRPTDTFESQFRSRFGNFNAQEFNLAVSGPLSDTFRYRATATTVRRDGYIKNLGGPDLDQDDAQAWSLSFELDLADNLALYTRTYGRYQDAIRTGDQGYQLTPYYTDASISALGASPSGVYVGPGNGDPHISALYYNPQYGWNRPNPAADDPRTVDLNSVPRVDAEKVGAVVNLTWALPAATVKYIGGYESGDYVQDGEDLDRTSRQPFDPRADDPGIGGGTLEISLETNQWRYSHELQLLSDTDAPLSWVAGLYHYRENRELPYWQRDLANPNLDTYVGVPDPSAESLGLKHFKPRTLYYQYGELDVESYAMFGEVEYQFNDQWALKTGLRYSHDKKRGAEEQWIATDRAWRYGLGEGAPGQILVNRDLRTLEDSWENLSGRLVLNHTPDSDTLMYASLSTGYKSGGMLLGDFVTAPGIDPIFDEETLVSFEVGYKSTLSRQLQINAAGFLYDYKDMQVKTVVINPVSLSNTPAMFNAEDSRIYGVELETTWLPGERLRVMANYSYMHTEFASDEAFVNEYFGHNGEGAQTIEGNSLVQAPAHKLSLRADYNWYSPIGEFQLAGHYAWIDEQEFRIFNDPEVRSDAYANVDLFLTWIHPHNSGIWLQGYIKNATDNDAITTYQAERKHIVQGVVNPPRLYGLVLNYSF